MVYHLISFFSPKKLSLPRLQIASASHQLLANGKRAPSELFSFIDQSWLGLDLAFVANTINQESEVRSLDNM